MRRKRGSRVLALLLSAMMVFTTLTTAVFAVEDGVTTDNRGLEERVKSEMAKIKSSAESKAPESSKTPEIGEVSGTDKEDKKLLTKGGEDQASLSLEEQLRYFELKTAEGKRTRSALPSTYIFKIATAHQLAELATKVNAGDNDYNTAKYQLVRDIDLSGYDNWIAIGNDPQNMFSGTFDGKGYKITNLTIDREGAAFQGLFGLVDIGGIIQNLGVENDKVKGEDRVGGIAGGSTGTIENCYSTGSISGENFVGGLVGQNYGAVTNCYSISNVSGVDYVGGLLGNNDGTVTNCYVAGSIKGNNLVGGLVGESREALINCYSTGSVSGNENVGGLIGDNVGTITNCYSTGSVSGNGYVGGIAGYNREGKNLKNCVSLSKTVSGNIGVGRVVGRNDGAIPTNNYAWKDMKLTGTPGIGDNGKDLSYSGATGLSQQFSEIFGADNTAWDFDENKLPTLKNVGGSQNSDLPQWVINETQDTYFISTAKELAELATQVNNGSENTTGKTYVLTADIDLKDYAPATTLGGSTGWTPIGNDSNPFNGSFDAKGYKIKNLTIENPSADYQGLFGYISVGSVKNLGVENCKIQGKDYVAGLVGWGRNIKNCYSTGSVSGEQIVGGLVGYNGENIKNCYSTGNVSGTGGYVGGVVGANQGTIENCYATGNVSGDGFIIGGVVGENSGEIISCYSTGSVSGAGNVGGVAGYSVGSTTIKDCVSLSPSISASASGDVGRVVGVNDNGTLTNNYAWDGVKLTGTQGNGDNGSELSYNGTTGLSQQFNSIFSADNTAWTFGENKMPTLENVGGSQNSGLPQWVVNETQGAYFISTAKELAELATKVNDGSEDTRGKTYVLTADIDLKDYAPSTALGGTTGWTPIGNDFSNRFSGTFDGKGHKIKNLTIENKTAEYQGLFGYIEGMIQNLGVENCDITGTGDKVGGLVGVSAGYLQNCYSTGSISGHNEVGGLVGFAGGIIENCYSTGSISGSNNVGGLVGRSSMSITNGYSTGNVSGDGHNVGGLVGYNSGTVKSCYSTANVNGSLGSAGGIAGRNGGGTIRNCVSLSLSVSGVSDVGRVVGLNYGGTFTNNHAWTHMKVTVGGSDKPLDVGGDKADGQDVIQVEGLLKNADASAFEWTAFDESVWEMPKQTEAGTYRLPRLKDVSKTFPEMTIGLRSDVVITTTATTSFDYAAGEVDITKAFAIPEYAGTAKYTIQGTGATDVSLSEAGKLTISNRPTSDMEFTIKVVTEQNPAAYSAEQTAKITVIAPTITAVTVTPETADVTAGNTQQFTAAVTGTGAFDKTVNWTVTGKSSEKTSITAAGLLTVGADETADTLTVKATSKQDSGKAGTATVTTKTVVKPIITGVTITPKTAEVAAGNTQQFTAKVTGLGDFDQTVKWTVEGAKSTETSITTDGLLTVGADETADTLTVKATSTQDNGKVGTATVTTKTVVEPIIMGVTITPKTAEVAAGNTQQFTAKVSGVGDFDQTVKWTVEGAKSAKTSITKAGLLTVGADETAKMLTIKATSKLDSDKLATATVKMKAGGGEDIPASGDFNLIWIWFSCMLASGGALFFLREKGRKASDR